MHSSRLEPVNWLGAPSRHEKNLTFHHPHNSEGDIMASQQSAQISIKNDMGGNASIVLFHTNSSNGTQREAWNVGREETAGPMKVMFETGFGTGGILDYWSVLVHVKDGPCAGFFVNSGTAVDPFWKECQLQYEDKDRSITLSISPSKFDIPLPSGGCSDGLRRLAPGAPLTHVFVLALENHSFDNVFAMSGIPGIEAATTSDSNAVAGTTYFVQPSAPISLTTDPGHEFADVVQQLSGLDATFPKGGPYPRIDNSGFAASYATSTSEEPHKPPQPERVIDIMSCFDTQRQMRTIYDLATQFAVCDHWYSSMPGPTWPNRFFIHGASSSGFDDSPTTAQMTGWELPGGGFKYPNGSIFARLNDAQIPYRIYRDAQSSPPYLSLFSDNPQLGSALGAIPQVSSLSGVTLADVESLQDFAADLQGPYPFPYTFIEPHYGDVTGGTYAGGSSQHPMDDVYGGENLLAAVYSAIRSSPYWATSLLIVTYDEHGGFYDSAAPRPAPAPGDNPSYGYNTHGFDFTTLGVRVPAVVVSPLIAAGTVDHEIYDHASIPALLEKLWGLRPLTQRDAAAGTPLHLLSLTTPREAPQMLAVPQPNFKAADPGSPADRVTVAAQPVPLSGNLAGALAILRKTDAEVSAAASAAAAAKGMPNPSVAPPVVKTRADVERYAVSVLDKVRLVKEQRRQARGGRL